MSQGYLKAGAPKSPGSEREGFPQEVITELEFFVGVSGEGEEDGR